MPQYMYVSLQDDDKVLVLTIDGATGELTPQTDVPAPGGPSAMAISPDGRVIYLSHRNANQISSHQIDPASGGLTQIGQIAVEAAPTYLATDRTGRYLLSAYYQGAHAAVHSIGDDGSVVDPPIDWLETDVGAHSIQTDPSNRFAFVPHIARQSDNVLQPPGDALGPNVIFQFKFDPASGHLTPNSPLRLEMDGFLGPRHLCFHPTLDVLYFSNEQGCSVSAYSVDRSTGCLTPIQTISSVPEGYTGRNTCSQIKITPSGKFLYVPNRGHNSIAGFAVDPSTGRLTSIGQVATEAVPSAFGLDPAGNFLFAAGSASDRLAAYRVNGETGALAPLQTYTVGKRPMEVLTTSTGS